MKFEIKIEGEKLHISSEGKSILEVKRRHDWRGRFISSYFRGQELILETTYNLFFTYKFLSIKYKNAAISIRLIREGRKYYLWHNGDILKVDAGFLSNRKTILLRNEMPIGEVSFRPKSQGTDVDIIVTFQESSDSDFYLLLLFLMELPPQTIA